MARHFEQRQRAQVAHRVNFWGLPTGAGTISWQYKTQDWLVKRPEDGEPPVERIVRCKTCRKALTYRVHSVDDTLHRYNRWRTWAYGGLSLLLLGLLGLVLLFVVGGGAVGTALVITAMAVGAMTGWMFGLTAANEQGVTGHLNGWPGATKHAVVFIAPGPELVCPRCGHREEFPSGPGYREGPPEQRYRAAKARMDRHDCVSSS